MTRLRLPSLPAYMALVALAMPASAAAPEGILLPYCGFGEARLLVIPTESPAPDNDRERPCAKACHAACERKRASMKRSVGG